MSLLPEEYDKFERRFADHLPYLILRMFQPYLFYEYGIPVRLRSLERLYLYVDMLHEAANKERYLREALYSPTELKYMARHRDLCERISGQFCARPTRPIMAGPRVVDMFRCIDLLEKATGTQTARVLEVGPGSSALGCMAVQRGWQYACFEVTQSFFVWQYHLLERASDSDLDGSLDTLEPPSKLSARATVIPWWRFGRYHTQSVPSLDVVVCDRAIGEMLPEAFGYIFRTSGRMLADSPIGAFLFSHVGTPRFVDNDSLISRLKASGWRHLRVEGIEPVNILLHPESSLNIKKLAQSRSLSPVVEPGDDGKSQSLTSAWTDVDLNKISESYSIFDYVAGYVKPQDKQGWLDILLRPRPNPECGGR